MKRIRKREVPPSALIDYIRDYPESSDAHSWTAFREGKCRLQKVQQALYEDQGGLCAYCELELIPKFDFRVSHFHPKREKGQESDNSWELRWSNMHGACNGGTVYDFRHPKRYVEDNSDVDKHCDVVIGNDNLDNVILNPLDMVAFPILFRYEEENLPGGQFGLRIVAEEENCSEAKYLNENGCLARAQKTIDLLHLNSSNLKAMRHATYEEIKLQIAKFLENGDDVETAMEHIAEVAFSNPSKWPEFFTVWRWALRDKAEEKLKSINYIG